MKRRESLVQIFANQFSLNRDSKADMRQNKMSLPAIMQQTRRKSTRN